MSTIVKDDLNMSSFINKKQFLTKARKKRFQMAKNILRIKKDLRSFSK